MNYLLDVITDNVADAVRHACGLMFDSGRAGWHVRVVTDDATLGRALAILGTQAIASAESIDAFAEPGRAMRTLVLSIDDAGVDSSLVGPGIRLIDPHARCLLWGRRVNHELATLHRVRHELSGAARTFKGQALHCAGLGTRVAGCEEFWADDAFDSYPFSCLPAQPAPAQRGRRMPTGVRARPPSPDVVG